MDALQSLFRSTIASDQAQMLVLFLLFLPPFFFSYWAVKRGLLKINLRPIPGYETLKALLAKAAEAGQPVHVSVGIAGIGDQHTADTMAGLEVLEYVAERAAISATPPIVTVSNPTALPVAQDLLQRAYRRQGLAEEYDPARARLIAPDPSLGAPSPNASLYSGGTIDATAYAAGTMQLLTQQPLMANVMVGWFGDEFLLLGETGAQRQLNQIGGTSATRALPFFYATMANPLIGEEIYAGGAYLSNRSSHISSLMAQDVMRWLVVGFLVVAIILRTLGLI